MKRKAMAVTPLLERCVRRLKRNERSGLRQPADETSGTTAPHQINKSIKKVIKMSMQKESLAQKSVYWMKVISLGLVLGLGIQFAEAWTSPIIAPPGGNVSGPITTSGIGQIKQGNLALNANGIYAHALIIQSGDILTVSGSSGSTYGAVTLQGSKNGWSGINFKDINGSNAGTLMMHPSYSGFFNAADNGWRWYVDNNGGTYQPGSMIIGGKASSTSTAAGDPGTTMVTKDYVDGKVSGGGTSGLSCVKTGIPPYSGSGYGTQTFPNGYVIVDGCLNFTCTNGQWTYAFNGADCNINSGSTGGP